MNKKGFTLIEMLLAMGILVVLSTAILVAISSQRDKARLTRTLSEMSATIQPIEMCLADGGNIRNPGYGVDICTLSSRYGQWPGDSSDGFSSYARAGNWGLNTWSFRRQQTSSGTYVCCSATWIGCKTGADSNCN